MPTNKLWYTSQITVERISRKPPKESARPLPQLTIQEEIDLWEEKLQKFKGQREISRIGYSPSTHSEFDKSPYRVEELTSAVYTMKNPPQDWCDISFLIPHEAIRHELAALYDSIDALDGSTAIRHSWKTLYFAKWFVNVFCPMIDSHHENEEEIFFPWIETKIKLPPILANCHEELSHMLSDMEQTCYEIIKKEGRRCAEEIQQLQDAFPPFCFTLSAHLQSEEELIPPLLRNNFTEAEHEAILMKLQKREGLSGLRLFLPSILAAMNVWGKPEFVESIQRKIPAPIRYLVNNYYVPDYENVAVPMRDAPKLTTKPTLSKFYKFSFLEPIWDHLLQGRMHHKDIEKASKRAKTEPGR